MKIYNKSNTSNKTIHWKWSIKILILSLSLSISFSIISAIALNSTTIIISAFIIVIFLIINVVMDMIGVAITAGDINRYKQLCNKNFKGYNEGLLLLKNADKVSVFCCDIIGDICGILSGACGASIVLRIISESSGGALHILLSSLISGLIAGFTIFFKSIEKGYAVKFSENIIFKTGKILSFFKIR